MYNEQNDDDLEHVQLAHSIPRRRTTGELHSIAILDQRTEAGTLLVNLRSRGNEPMDGVDVVFDVGHLRGAGPDGAQRLSVGFGADRGNPLFQIYCDDDRFVLVLPPETVLRRDELGRRSYSLYERVLGEQDEAAIETDEGGEQTQTCR